MEKVDWLKKQIKKAGNEVGKAQFIPQLITAVESAGDDMTRTDFKEIFESFEPDDSGSEYCKYRILDTELCYGADFSEAWDIQKMPDLPVITAKSSHEGTPLPDDFIKLGGEPDWVQDENIPICSNCDGDMVLFAQIKSLSELDKYPSLQAYCFGDGGTVYLFTCCGEYKTIEQCY